nr:hypothetical protein [Jiangella rhizosphaerae]
MLGARRGGAGIAGFGPDAIAEFTRELHACWYWRSDVDGNATWGPTSRPVPQWTRPGATPAQTLGRRAHDH